MNDPRFTIGCITQLTENGVEQTVDFFGETIKRAVNVHAAQMEAGVRAKLIELGWTPPRDPSMTTTEEVPMPEPVAWRQQFGVFEHAKWHYFHGSLDPREVHDNGKPCEPVYTPDQLRAYADVRCAKLQDERDAYKAADEAMQEEVGRLHAEIHELKAERDALAEKVKAMEDNDRRYRWLRDRATFENDCEFWLPSVIAIDYKPGAELNGMHETLDTAIDAAGGDQC